MAVDEQKVEEAAGKVFGELSVAITGPLIVLGDRLGLWAAMAGAGPVTPNELAARTGTVERYAREWLRGVAVAGYVGCDPAGGTFTLPDEMALVIAGEDSPASLIGVFDGFIGLWNDLATIEGFFRAGGGMGWGDHHSALNDAQARFTRPMYLASLVDGWIAALDGVTGRLAAGARVADIGYDLVTFTDCLYDLGDPVAAAARARSVLAPGGTTMIIEPLAADRLEDDFSNPYARIGYAISTLVCTPSSLAQPGAAALGAMAGEARLRQVLAEAGYARVRRVAQEAAPFNIVLEAQP